MGPQHVTREHAAERYSGDNSTSYADNGELHGTPDHEDHGIELTGSECHPDAKVMHALGNPGVHHAVDANERQYQARGR